MSPKNTLMAVKICSKGLLARCVGQGKSPCFSRLPILTVISPDWGHYFLVSVDGAKSVECAFCYGNQ